MATAMFAKTLENLQHSIWLIPQRQNHELNSYTVSSIAILKSTIKFGSQPYG
jgi:hypothetical protein